MVAIGTRAGLRTRAVLTAMDAPLGLAVGNSLEIIEAIETLKGRGPDDFRELCLLLSAHLLIVAGIAPDLDAARRRWTPRWRRVPRSIDSVSSSRTRAAMRASSTTTDALRSRRGSSTSRRRLLAMSQR